MILATIGINNVMRQLVSASMRSRNEFGMTLISPLDSRLRGNDIDFAFLYTHYYTALSSMQQGNEVANLSS
ncbi:MAG: hypothetical protein RCG15_05270 [Candidatus Rickettsia vulgarisii]